MAPDDPRHGIHAGYRAGCRDECCRRANALRMNRYRLRKLQGELTTTDATGSVRRIRALMALGWTAREMSAYLGWSARETQQLVTDSRGWISVQKARRVKAMYDQLSMIRPEGWVAERQRRVIAMRHGWAPPLAWDDIDDPATPADRLVCRAPQPYDVDEVVVIRILSGDYRLAANDAEQLEVIRRWRGSLNDLERFTGWNVRRVIREAASLAELHQQQPLPIDSQEAV